MAVSVPPSAAGPRAAAGKNADFAASVNRRGRHSKTAKAPPRDPLLASILVLGCTLLCQGPGDPSPHGEAAQRVGTVTEIEPEQAPRLDGRLDDPCWQGAPSIGDFVQVEPMEGVVPSQRTVLRMVRDRRRLYIAIECFDDEPDLIRATQRFRDADLDPDDRVEMIFDPFGVGNLAYFLQVGAAGSIGDALMSNTSFTKSWDTIWDARVRRDRRGWYAEAVVPFRSLAFPDDTSQWKFNVRRVRRWSNEAYRWANARQSVRFFRLAELGTLTGMGGIIRGGVGVDVVPYTTYRIRRDRLQSEAWRGDLDAGGELFFRLTPSLNAALTFFTDFAETENDSRQINLSRFPLFFPERRDFFLQDESRFRFGSGDSDLLPFFSRRIGLGSEGTIPIQVGAKLAGQIGNFGVGVLGVRTGEGGGNDFERGMGVARVDYALAEQSRVGLIATHGRPTERGQNQVFGVDMFHRVPEFVGDLDLRVWSYLVKSETSGDGGDGAAGAIDIESQGREWSFELRSRWVGDEFNPELGRVRRPGVKEFEFGSTYRPRTDVPAIRTGRFQWFSGLVLDSSNRVLDANFEIVPFGIQTHMGDFFRMSIEREFERLDDPFDIFDDVEIAAGDYWRTRYGARFGLSEGRAFSGGVRFETGDFFDGNAWEYSASADWRPDLCTCRQPYDQNYPCR